MRRSHSLITATVLLSSLVTGTAPLAPLRAAAQTSETTLAQARPAADDLVACDILIVGGGLAGTATAYESLKGGHTVCMTEITDWVGGQLSSQGTTALDEAPRQRALLWYAQGYNELRDRIEAKYGKLNPGGCWVSVACFMPYDANDMLMEMLAEAEREGGGELKWFPNTVVKDLSLNAAGNQIESVMAIQHSPAPGTAPLYNERLSQIIEDAYTYADSARLSKDIIQFVPTEAAEGDGDRPADWYVIEATETGELIALAGVPHQLGLDPRSPLNPSSPVTSRDSYCPQAFTYTFAMEHTEDEQTYDLPSFYETYRPIYGFDPRNIDAVKDAQGYFDFVFTYRRIWNASPKRSETIFGVPRPAAGDISMQNWLPGNDYNPGTFQDNLIYTQEQLAALGQLEPGGWMGGLRTETLRKGEESALGFFYWLATSDTNNSNFRDDPIFGDNIKDPYPYLTLLQGVDSPMGTAHGLSKYPYMREGRRIIGRPSYGYESGFVINELDFSMKDFADEYYQDTLSEREYLSMRRFLAGLETLETFEPDVDPNAIHMRMRSRIYPDAVGISQYSIDFHPCYLEYPVEKPGNIERPGVRQAHGKAYPAQIPLRAMIPQNIDNMLVASKSIATGTAAAASYRVHSFEWSVGAAAGHTTDFALREGVLPFELVDDLPRQEPLLEQLKQEIEASGNPVMFPGTSIFNEDWEDWRS
ncbi:MAG: FAD-dependent oxidoreductase [Cyanobacteria bacterium J06638_6]